jgi:hypothetical protein
VFDCNNERPEADTTMTRVSPIYREKSAMPGAMASECGGRSESTCESRKPTLLYRRLHILWRAVPAQQLRQIL